MIASADIWLGKNLFQPLIIRVCQIVGLTQFAVHRYLWLGATYYLIYRIDDIDPWLIKAILIVGGNVYTCAAGLFPDAPAPAIDWLRRFFVVALGIDLAMAALLIEWPSFVLLAMLFAEYALTIKTIPPPPAERVKHRVALGHG